MLALSGIKRNKKSKKAIKLGHFLTVSTFERIEWSRPPISIRPL